MFPMSQWMSIPGAMVMLKFHFSSPFGLVLVSAALVASSSLIVV